MRFNIVLEFVTLQKVQKISPDTLTESVTKLRRSAAAESDKEKTPGVKPDSKWNHTLTIVWILRLDHHEHTTVPTPTSLSTMRKHRFDFFLYHSYHFLFLHNSYFNQYTKV